MVVTLMYLQEASADQAFPRCIMMYTKANNMISLT